MLRMGILSPISSDLPPGAERMRETVDDVGDVGLQVPMWYGPGAVCSHLEREAFDAISETGGAKYRHAQGHGQGYSFGSDSDRFILARAKKLDFRGFCFVGTDPDEWGADFLGVQCYVSRHLLDHLPVHWADGFWLEMLQGSDEGCKVRDELLHAHHEGAGRQGGVDREALARSAGAGRGMVAAWLFPGLRPAPSTPLQGGYLWVSGALVVGLRGRTWGGLCVRAAGRLREAAQAAGAGPHWRRGAAGGPAGVVGMGRASSSFGGCRLWDFGGECWQAP